MYQRCTWEAFQGYVAVFMACCALAPLGHVATLANMMPYLTSYMHKYTDTAVDYSVAIWLSCCVHAVQGIATPLTALLLPRVGSRPLLLFAWFAHILGILLTGWTIKVGFGAVIFSYAIMVGWGIGGSYGIVIANAASWFPKHRGLVVGICACGFGAGAILLTPIQTLIINPHNLAVNNVTQMFDDETMLDRVPKCLYIIGGGIAVIQLIGCMCALPKPEEKKPEDQGEIEVAAPEKAVLEEDFVRTDLPLSKTILRVDLYLFWMIMCLSIIPLTLITGNIKVVGQKSIPDDKYLSLVNTFGAFFNTASRIVWGPVCDHLSYKVPLSCLNFFYGAVLITLPFIPPIPLAGRYLYVLWVAFVYLCVAGNFVALPFGISRAFGHKHFVGNYGIVFSAFTPGSIIGALVVYFVKLEHYLTEIFVVCGVVCFCSSLIALFLTDIEAPKAYQAISWRRFKKKT